MIKDLLKKLDTLKGKEVQVFYKNGIAFNFTDSKFDYTLFEETGGTEKETYVPETLLIGTHANMEVETIYITNFEYNKGLINEIKIFLNNDKHITLTTYEN